ncbi:MAG: hypothetical protein HY790_03325 [Deltaproteobacteria bacterium]|nr:hypothetical protein [Deltaproteobacteria bacterium]
MGKIIPFSDLARQHQLNLLEHKRREYREREDYLARLRRLLFKIEGQMRQAEIQQLQVFQELSENLRVPLEFPSLGDRVALQEFFATDPFLLTLQEFLAGRLTAEECYRRILELKGETAPSLEG